MLIICIILTVIVLFTCGISLFLQFTTLQILKAYDDRTGLFSGGKAHWEHVRGSIYKCSKCGGMPVYQGGIFEYKYCPYCGAVHKENKKGSGTDESVH